MLKYERLARIEEYVDINKYVTISELSDEFKISSATIRRDLELLGQEHRVELTRGGAISNKKATVNEQPYKEKLSTNQAEKARIAQATAALLTEGSTVILDSGTTTRELIPHLSTFSRLNLVTNDVITASELTMSPGCDITVLGGSLRKGYYTLLGHYAENMVSQIRADVAILGIDSVSLRAGCMISNMDEVGLKRAIAGAARQVIVVCDHTKFEVESFVTVFPLSSVDLFITGRELSPRIAGALREMGVKIQQV